eukprot:2426434-Ditylum_brightwellii.AAC.1
MAAFVSTAFDSKGWGIVPLLKQYFSVGRFAKFFLFLLTTGTVIQPNVVLAANARSQKPFQLNGSSDFVRDEDFIRIAAWGDGTKGCKVLLEDDGFSDPLFCDLCQTLLEPVSS